MPTLGSPPSFRSRPERPRRDPAPPSRLVLHRQELDEEAFGHHGVQQEVPGDPPVVVRFEEGLHNSPSFPCHRPDELILRV